MKRSLLSLNVTKKMLKSSGVNMELITKCAQVKNFEEYENWKEIKKKSEELRQNPNEQKKLLSLLQVSHTQTLLKSNPKQEQFSTRKKMGKSLKGTKRNLLGTLQCITRKLQIKWRTLTILWSIAILNIKLVSASLLWEREGKEKTFH